MPIKRIPRIWQVAIGVLGLFLIWQGILWFSPKSSLKVIRSVKVKRGDLTVTTTAAGEVKPQNRVEIKPPIAGRIEQVLVKEGDAVSQGQVLAWMSSSERAALLDAARSKGDDALARWEEAYKPAPLMAPLEGNVIVRAVEPGQTVTTGDPVVVLADRLIVEALVDETDLALIEVGQEARVKLDAYPGQLIPAVVDHVAYESKLINNVNVYAVDILPTEAPQSFRSGMTAAVTFVIADRKGVLLVPSEAIAEWPQGAEKPKGYEFAVYQKAFGGAPKPVPVRFGESDGKMTEILDGIKEGSEVLVVRRKESSGGVNPFSRFGGRRRSRQR